MLLNIQVNFSVSKRIKMKVLILHFFELLFSMYYHNYIFYLSWNIVINSWIICQNFTQDNFIWVVLLNILYNFIDTGISSFLLNLKIKQFEFLYQISLFFFMARKFFVISDYFVKVGLIADASKLRNIWIINERGNSLTSC